MEYVFLRIARQTLPALVLLLAGCTASRGGTAQNPPGATRNETAPASNLSTSPARSPSRLPDDAFALLAESAAESCAVCARDLKREAFAVLEETLVPGVRLGTDSTAHFTRAAKSEDELEFVPSPDGGTRLSLRFHTGPDHLVGIAERDYTEPRLAARVASAPAGTLFRGTVEIVPFAYGDGAAWLYFEKENHVQVQCRIIEIEVEGARAAE